MFFLLASDKFKGSLTSVEVGKSVERGLRKRWPQARVSIFPMADGGDGFDDVMDYYYSLQQFSSHTLDPLHRPIEATWRWEPKTKTAFIAVAAASGLALLKNNERNPEHSSSMGTGILLKEALRKGARKIVLGLGGSATNDAGMGMLVAMDFILLDDKGHKLTGTGEHLQHIRKIIPPTNLIDIEFDIACDVENPLYGENGAAFVYAPQKGADSAMVKRLDEGLQNVALVLEQSFGKALDAIPGLGAAGGMAAGLMPFFKVNLRSGIEMILEASKLAQFIPQCDVLITGEGKLDTQSLQGKVVGTLAKLAQKNKKQCIAVCGINELPKEVYTNAGISQVISIRDLTDSDKEAMENAADLLERAMENLET